MVELNEKAKDHDRIWLEPAGAPDRCWCEDNQWGEDGVEYVRVSALPAPDDGLVERLREDAEYIDNYVDFTGSPDRIVRSMLEAATALQSKNAELQHLRADAKNPDKGMWTFWNEKARELSEKIERLTSRSAVLDSDGIAARKAAAANYARAEAAEQQVQKLTAEKAKLHKTGQEYLVASEAVFDWMNGNDLSADHEEQCPQDFARVCKAIVEFRSALETEGRGE